MFLSAIWSSLHSKRFRASLSRKLGLIRNEGIVHSLLLLQVLRNTPRLETLVTQARYETSYMSNVESYIPRSKLTARIYLRQS